VITSIVGRRKIMRFFRVAATVLLLALMSSAVSFVAADNGNVEGDAGQGIVEVMSGGGRTVTVIISA
jgi:hypothetical protein